MSTLHTTARPTATAPATGADVRGTQVAPGTLPGPLAVLTAAAAGPMMDWGFPDGDIWPLTLVGVGLLLWALIGRTAAGGFLVGLVGGLSFYLIHIEWATTYLGPLPWAALSTLQALFVAVAGSLIAIAYRVVTPAWPGVVGRLVLLPVIVAGLWTAREAIASVWPYGGFAWGRVALSQTEGLFAPLLAWFGLSGLSFLLVLMVAIVVQCLREFSLPATTRALVAATGIVALLAIPAFPVSTEGSTRIAAVQGNAKAGYFDQRQPGDILNAHVSATLPLVGDNVDMVVWPENGTDLDPMSVPVAAEVFDYLTQVMDAPLVGGTITNRDDKWFNTSFVWEHGVGTTQLYDKKHPVPFGEYVPDREFWRPFAPHLIDLIAREYTPGTLPNVFDVNGINAGLAICFDIGDDQLITEMMRDNAQVILAQTNNADFGRTDESVQQLAIARARAIETGRSVVNISTVGTSAMIAPDGSTLAQLPWFTAGAMVEDVPLGTSTTPASMISRQLEWLAAGLGLGGLTVALATRQRHVHPRRLSF